MNISRSAFVLLITAILCMLVCCDLILKSGLPEGHTEDLEGAFHMEEADKPSEGNGGCASSDGHQPDLKGSAVDVEGVRVVTPSCFQCHGALWEGHD